MISMTTALLLSVLVLLFYFFLLHLYSPKRTAMKSIRKLMYDYLDIQEAFKKKGLAIPSFQDADIKIDADNADRNHRAYIIKVKKIKYNVIGEVNKKSKRIENISVTPMN